VTNTNNLTASKHVTVFFAMFDLNVFDFKPCLI